MRILWVEDNGNVVKNRQHLFGDFLESHDFQHISDFSLADSEISDKLCRYDLIILDINLEASLVDKSVIELANKFELLNPDFLEEAGFHLYLKLLEQGFPQTQVIFLTGNINTIETRVEKILHFKKVINESTDAKEQRQVANELAPLMSFEERNKFEQMLIRGERKTQIFQWLDEWAGQLITENIEGETIKNTYEIFEQRFKDARLIPPRAIDKKQDCSKNLQNWLRTHCERNSDNAVNYDYLTLRRGILNVVTEIKEDSTIKLNQTFPELDKTTFLEGLTCHLRDFSLPNIEYCQLYSTLCEYLTKPFQEAYDGKDLRQDENRHLKLPLYNLRNWIVHGLLVGSDTRLFAQEVGITFLLAMKDIFNVEKYGHYGELKQLFDTSSVTRQQLINQIKVLSRKREYYADQWKKPLDVIHRKTNKNSNRNWQQENYISHFYATYLFSIQHLDSYELKDTPFNSIVFHQLQRHL